jgi:hypothetical protein
VNFKKSKHFLKKNKKLLTAVFEFGTKKYRRQDSDSKKGREKMKDVVCLIASAAFLVFAVFFAIDAEVARIDRAAGKDPTGCIFLSNCWN